MLPMGSAMISVSTWKAPDPDVRCREGHKKEFTEELVSKIIDCAQSEEDEVAWMGQN